MSTEMTATHIIYRIIANGRLKFKSNMLPRTKKLDVMKLDSIAHNVAANLMLASISTTFMLQRTIKKFQIANLKEKTNAPVSEYSE